MKQQVIFLKGLPASGKSTYARSLVDQYPGQFKRVNKDDLRAMLDNSKWSGGNEKFVLHLRDAIISTALTEGRSVIVDDTNLHPKHETHIRDIVSGYNAHQPPGKHCEFEVMDFTDVGLTECIARDRARDPRVGDKVITEMFTKFILPQRKLLNQDATLPHAIIVDLDGTLALLNGRNPYDASTADQDLLNEPVADIVKKYNGTIILVSGRTDNYREPTEKFLAKFSIPYTVLLMRQFGDNRKDNIIKQEIFDANIRGKYYIDYVLDDRTQVINMWRDLGLTALQCNHGDF